MKTRLRGRSRYGVARPACADKAGEAGKEKPAIADGAAWAGEERPAAAGPDGHTYN